MIKPFMYVIVTAYNAEPWLAQTLDSATGQMWLSEAAPIEGACLVLVSYVLWVMRRAEAIGLRHLYCLSRDGHILLDIVRLLADKLSINLQLRYLHVGCSQAFVQYSVIADFGGSEGTSVAVMKAGAATLPVVSTRHGGIPDGVQEGKSRLLVDQRDVAGTAEAMLKFAHDPVQAQTMGHAARRRIREHFSMDRSIGTPWTIVQEASGGTHHAA
jgi:glycosyltransferase involved in cell wall biosynthesis